MTMIRNLSASRLLWKPLFGLCALVGVAMDNQTCLAQPTGATDSGTIDFGIYQNCPVLENDRTRVVLCPQVGGRVLEFSLDGVNALFVSKYELTGTPSELWGKSPSAGRFDIGPEKVVAKRPELFSGAWQWKRTGPHTIEMKSQPGKHTGVTLNRKFELDAKTSRLTCVQTISNTSDHEIQNCHWSRTFGKGAGIVLIPLEGFSRFPNRYVRYENGAIQIAPRDPNVRQRDGFLELLGPPLQPKLGMDSYAGWLAHQQPSGILFIKQFPTYPNRNYCEVAGLTISTWTPEAGHLVELEPIGPAENLAPGQSASFTEIWSLHKQAFPRDGKVIDLKKLRALYNELPQPKSVGPQD